MLGKIKNYYCMLFVSIMAIALYGCGQTDTTNTVIEEDVIAQEADTVIDNEESVAIVSEVETQQAEEIVVTDVSEYTISEPDIIDVSEYEKQIYFYRDGLKIFGKLYLPEGEENAPILVMQPGFRGSQSLCGSMKDKFLENGIACLTFDCIGATSPSKSDGMILDMTFLTEVKDMNAVLDSISQLPRIDTDNIFVYGHSVGGLVVTYTATHRDDVKGIIAAEPSYQMQDTFVDSFPNDNEIPESFMEPLYGGKQMAIDAKSLNPYENMDQYSNKVIIFAGGTKPSIGAEAKEYLDKAVELFPNAELVSIEEADHSFSGDSGQELIEKSVEFINHNRNLEE